MNVKNTTPIKLDLDFSGKEFLGDRSGQEDYSLFRTLANGTELIAVLADGMGGHTSGEIASKLAVDTFDNTFSKHTSSSVPIRLGAGLQQSNSELANSIRSNPSLDGMGCTLVGVYISKAGIEWISVGDSPLFLYREGKLIRLNADHSMAPVIAESLKSGKITEEEANSHPNRNALRSALMGGELNLIDASISPKTLFEGDIAILASDGLLTLTEGEIEKLLVGHKKGSAKSIADLLINEVKAKRRPRQDNTTVQVVVIPKILASGRSSIFRFGVAFLVAGLLSIGVYFAFLNSDIRQTVGDVISRFGGADQVKPTPIPASDSTSSAGQGLEGIKQSPETSSQPDVKKDEHKKESSKAKPSNPPSKQKEGLHKEVPAKQPNSVEKESGDSQKPDQKPNSKPDTGQDKNVEA